MKANNTQIHLAYIMGKEAKSSGLYSISQDSDFLQMLMKFGQSFSELREAYVEGFNSKIK